MEYAIIVVLLLFGIVQYDFKGRNDRKEIFFKLVYILMVLMSGLAYRVGADFVRYEEAYYIDYAGGLDYSFRELLSFAHRQPGWVIISSVFYKSGASFTVFKLAQAALFQFAVFSTIRKYTNYRYTALLLFFVFVFPQANFNVLRESFAISFFLLSIPHLLNRNWFKYFIFVFCAFLFHTGAILLFLFPLVFLLDFHSPKQVIITASIFFVLSLFAARANITETYMDLVYSTGNTGLIAQSEFYFLRDRYELTSIGNIGKSLLFFIINMIPLFYVAKHGNVEQKKLIPLAFLFILISLVNNFVPIAYRYKDYTYILFHLTLSTFLVEFSKQNIRKYSIIIVILLYGLYFYSVRSYFAVNRYYGQPAWVQYYPYHSVIDKGTSPVREFLFYN